VVTYRFKPKSEAERSADEREMFDQLEVDAFERRFALFDPSGALLRTRTRFNRSQLQMAAIADISLRAYQGYERREKTVPSTVMCRVAAHFELDLQELVTGHRSPPDKNVIARLTEDAIRVGGRVFEMFKASGMTGKESRAVTAQVLKWKRPGETADNDLLFAAVRQVTGSKYLNDGSEDVSENLPEE
jgi:transcriptional regulator with XRE-family HTH domain